MKRIRFFVSVLMCAAFVFSLTATGFAAADGDITLAFNEDGRFKIAVFADCQDVYPANGAMLAFMGDVLDEEQPDLVVFLGDNTVAGQANDSIAELIAPVDSRGVPFTFVFGNHDTQDSDVSPERTKANHLAQYRKSAYCMAYNVDDSLHGYANHNLVVMSSDGTKPAFDLFFLDSGMYSVCPEGSCYDCVHADQIAWFNEASDEVDAEAGGAVPALAFQHIIPKQIYDAIYPAAPYSDSSAFKRFADGTCFSLVPTASKYRGFVNELPCPSYYDYGEWDAFSARGNVLGVVTGHDHVNNFTATYKGVDFIQTSAMTFHSYGNNIVRGARIIELDEKDPWNYSTYNVTVRELAVKDKELASMIDDSFIYPFLNFIMKFYAVFDKITHLF
ncbi:MAG: metallophosphoesterase [Clostridia bacterium]|nr:metallophosphoesterase [Clostridia bacterium]